MCAPPASLALQLPGEEARNSNLTGITHSDGINEIKEMHGRRIDANLPLSVWLIRIYGQIWNGIYDKQSESDIELRLIQPKEMKHGPAPWR